MKLYYYKDPEGKINFGDDLNPWIWNKLCPTLINEGSTKTLIGIGTLLNNNIPNSKNKIVFSSGVGYGDDKIPNIDDTWKIYCVRGPLSANALNIPKEMAILDGAYLLRNIIKDFPEKKYEYSYIPHFHSANDNYRYLCESLGIHYIDPSKNIEHTLQELLSTKTLLAEAMHGAIIADCFNIPWVPMRTNNKILSFKWEDWCQSIELEYKPIDLMPLWEGNKNIFKQAFHYIKERNNLRIFKKIKNSGNKYTFISDRNILDKKIAKLTNKLNEMINNETIK